jgi:acetolactate synthase-1/2/3 large subunit
LGVGIANGLTNLHNARRAFTPLLNVIGDHATWHLPADPLLATDCPSSEFLGQRAAPIKRGSGSSG